VKPAAWVVALLASSGLALAQQSASFRLAEHTLNAGGRPAGGTVVVSASHSITLDAVGDAVTPGRLAGASFQLGGGFVSPYPPPGEVAGLRFTSATTLAWAPEPTAGTYNFYRGALASLGGLGYGACRTSAVAGTTTADPDVAPAGNGYFYLVTAANLLAEEGTKGFGSAGERPNPSPCP
jgi:hypothetical protein